jgi:Ca2+-binding RTX toxin-like protein
MSGGGARDVLKGGTGDDTLNGGSGEDKLYGGKGDDLINGGTGRDYINAGQGDDTIEAGDGRDKILMGSGADDVWGGSDSDWFVFRTSDANGTTDTIHDYTRDGTENDRLDLRSFNLLDDGTSQTDWFVQNVTQNADFSVHIDLGNLEIYLIDHDSRQYQFLNQVLEGLEC